MELRKLAETVLFSDAIEGKLASADVWSDQDRCGRATTSPPSLPARSAELALDSARPKQPFPSLVPGADVRTHGEVLHYFANHELLAIELMALFLLRFPEGPPKLRRAVAGTIAEEQKHLRLYLARMTHFGVAFGDLPVSRFFWDCLADMQGPLQYLAGMSLTLEQANLDFCAHYISRFTAIGDPETAALLQVVRDDEIGHVKLGAEWFERLKSPGDTRQLWDRYCAALRPPLTPARAVGIGFDFAARESAGLPPEFTEAVAGYGHSKGRPPVLHYFNPLAEFHLAAGEGKRAVPRALSQIATDLETLPMFLAGRDDAVLVSRRPRAAFLARLRRGGLTIPQFVTQDSCEGTYSRLAPWATSPDSTDVFKTLVAKQPSLASTGTDRECFSKNWSTGLAREWRQKNSQELTESPGWTVSEGCIGTSHQTSQVVMDTVRDLLTSGCRVVLKAPFGASGRGMIRVFGDAELHKATAWAERTIAQQGSVVVEPWLDRVADFSVQLNVGDDGAVRIVGITRFATDERGQYRGTLLGAPLRDLSRPLRQAIVGPGRRWRMFDHLEAAGGFVGDRLAAQGHRGPAGVDALVYRDEEGAFRLKPIVEVNPRCTMGHIALAVGKQLGPARRGRFVLQSRADAKRAGVGSLAELVTGLPEGSICLTDVECDPALVAVFLPE